MQRPFLVFALAILVLAIAVRPGTQAPAQAASQNFGVIFIGASGDAISRAMQQLGAFSWFDFKDTGANPSGYNKAVLVRSNEQYSQGRLQLMASQASAGAYWIIGNEPNVPGQDDISPANYAQRYKYYHDTISAIDPSAKFVAGNTLNWSTTCFACGGGFPNGQTWLSDVSTGFIQQYQTLFGTTPPVDVWGIHTYVIDWNHVPMVNWQQATQEISDFRSYLNTLPSEANKPIWVTEFGVIWGYPGLQSVANNQCSAGANCIAPTGAFAQLQVSDYLNQFVGWLMSNSSSKNIQKWFLFAAFGPPEVYSSAYAGISAMDGPGATANLSTSGQVYRDLAGGSNPTPTPPSGGGGGGGASTPTATTTPAPVSTPAPTATPAPADTTTGSMGSSGGELQVRGGSSADGGVSVIFPQSALDQGTDFAVAVVNEQPASVNPPSGATLLNKTVEVTARTLTTLRKTVGIRINLTAAELGGRALRDIRGGVITGATVEPRPTRIVDEAQGIVWIDVDHFSKFTLFAVTKPGPEINGPANEVILLNLGTTLTWTNPVGTTQYQVQVIPFNNDGPGIDLIRNAESSFMLQPPNFGGSDPNYVMLPGMHYVWRIRTTTSTSPPSQLTENDWSAWSLRSFVTTTKLSNTVSLASPSAGSAVNTRTPTLVWTNSDSEVFYYEVQVSKDPEFGANAFLYWELRHGGATNPVNSYTIPSQFPLEPNTTYFWRVRPRVQGDAAPVSWSSSSSFAIAP